MSRKITGAADKRRIALRDALDRTAVSVDVGGLPEDLRRTSLAQSDLWMAATHGEDLLGQPGLQKTRAVLCEAITAPENKALLAASMKEVCERVAIYSFHKVTPEPNASTEIRKQLRPLISAMSRLASLILSDEPREADLLQKEALYEFALGETKKMLTEARARGRRPGVYFKIGRSVEELMLSAGKRTSYPNYSGTPVDSFDIRGLGLFARECSAAWEELLKAPRGAPGFPTERILINGLIDIWEKATATAATRSTKSGLYVLVAATFDALRKYSRSANSKRFRVIAASQVAALFDNTVRRRPKLRK